MSGMRGQAVGYKTFIYCIPHALRLWRKISEMMAHGVINLYPSKVSIRKDHDSIFKAARVDEHKGGIRLFELMKMLNCFDGVIPYSLMGRKLERSPIKRLRSATSH